MADEILTQDVMDMINSIVQDDSSSAQKILQKLRAATSNKVNTEIINQMMELN